MRKLGFLVKCAMIIGAVALLMACFEPFGAEDTSDATVYYSENGEYITLAINGHKLPADLAAKANNRALTNQMAKLGHDYFEVVFKGPGGSPQVAKLSWSLGDSPTIYNVDASGVDYSSADASATVVGPVTAGSAMLFVGRRSDKTLLAVGLLIDSRNDKNGVVTTDTRVIDEFTTNVTFKVAALTAGASFVPIKAGPTTAFELGESSLVIEDSVPADITIIRKIKTDDGNQFPLYSLKEDSTLDATYTILSTRNSDGWPVPVVTTIPVANSMDAYKTGIFVAAAPAINMIVPRYAYAGQYRDITGTPAQIGVAMSNNTTVGTAFDNAIKFTLDTPPLYPEDPVYISSFYFRIPVYPIDASATTWFIRNGFGSYNLNLDNGIGGTGGAILVGVGDPTGIGITVDNNWYVVPPTINVVSTSPNTVTTGTPMTVTLQGVDFVGSFSAPTSVTVAFANGSPAGITAAVMGTTPASVTNPTSFVITTTSGLTGTIDVTVTVVTTEDGSVSKTFTINVN